MKNTFCRVLGLAVYLLTAAAAFVLCAFMLVLSYFAEGRPFWALLIGIIIAALVAVKVLAVTEKKYFSHGPY